MEEIWRDIYFFSKTLNELIDYRGYYQVSNLGRLRSVDRYVRGFNHGVEFQSLIKGKIIKCVPRGNCEYPLAHLSKNGKPRDYSLQRLVYFSFNPEADTALQVNHIDENKLNCALSNLNLMTSKENANWGNRNKKIKEKNAGVPKGPMPEWHKKKISEGNKNSVKHKAAAEKQKGIGTPVVCLDDNGNIIDEYSCISAAAEQLGICAWGISACCKKLKSRIHAGSYRWEYKKGTNV